MDKITLLKLISDGNYTVELEEPNNIDEYTKTDGSKFYVATDDDVKCGVDFGRCYVHVGECTFMCDLEWGEWSADNVPAEDFVDDDDIIGALEDADGVWYGEVTDLDDQMQFYAACNGIDFDTMEYYWYEDDDIPYEEE